MRAYSLHQPHASLVAAGCKIFETRAKPARTIVRIPVAVHAAKRIPSTEEWLDLAGAARDCYEMADAGLRSRIMRAMNGVIATRNEGMPFGAMICVVVFDEWIPATDIVGEPFGDFRAGRWAAPIREIIEVFDAPIPARGYQGPFHWERP